MSSEGVRANILVKKPSFGVGNEELLDISFKQFWEHEFQESRPVVCFTDSQLKARDERVARAAFDFAREVHEDTDVELFDSADDYINSEEFKKR